MEVSLEAIIMYNYAGPQFRYFRYSQALAARLHKLPPFPLLAPVPMDPISTSNSATSISFRHFSATHIPNANQFLNSVILRYSQAHPVA